MTPDHPYTRDLVLVGGGHAHALVLRRWGMNPLPGARLTLVNPGPTAPYTGMLPGHVAGHYDRDTLDIDLVRLCRFAGAALIDGAVGGIDAEAKLLDLGHRKLAYDVASIDIGITGEMPDLPGFAEHAVPAKPLDRFARKWRAFRDRALAGEVAAEIAVIGGGVAGVELALAMAHALRERDPVVTVLEAGPRMGGVGPKAASRLRRAMAKLGVAFRTDVTVAAVHADHVELAGADAVPSRFTLGAAGARAHDWITGTDLPQKDGFLRVDRMLRVGAREDLFAAGDCAHLDHAPRPKAGVYAVRAAPVLHDNLRAALSGRGLRPFRPQKGYLKLISMGGRTALAEHPALAKAGLAPAGPPVWRWKDRIDRAFMDRLTDLPVMETPEPPRVAALGREGTGKPLCAGCGSKIGGDALAEALARLPVPARADVLSRPGDDAAVLAAGEGRQVLTTDHLRAFTGDLDLMARIATVHALGDIWAMGAAPQAGLAAVTLPRMSETLQARSLGTVLDAISAVLREAGAELVGGHSTMGPETVIGLSLTGLCEGPAIGHDGARAGDAIILTRPIGTGVILAAEMAGAANGRHVSAMLRTMARPQADAAALLGGAGAMTDVTGFGLAGHLAAICRASGLGAEIAGAALPVYDGALDLAAAGHASVLRDANARAAPVDGAPGPLSDLLHDPQTAGGLLAAIAAERADATVERLRAAGHAAARIGRFVPGERIRLV